MSNRARQIKAFIREFKDATAAKWSGDEPTNEDRASWAYLGLRAYAVRTGEYEAASELDDVECWEQVVGDFIGDLAHLANKYGHSLGYAIERGMQFASEEMEPARA